MMNRGQLLREHQAVIDVPFVRENLNRVVNFLVREGVELPSSEDMAELTLLFSPIHGKEAPNDGTCKLLFYLMMGIGLLIQLCMVKEQM